MRVAAGILMDGDQARDATAALIFAAHRVTGAFGGDHDHIEISAGFDQAEVDVETMSKSKRRAGFHVCVQIVRINGGLMLVWREHHDDVGPSGSFLVGHDLKASAFRLRGRC